MDACIRMAESFRCSTETTTTLLIGYTPIQNEKFKVGVKKKNKKTRPIFLLEAPGENLCVLAFSGSKDTCVPGLMAASPSSKDL